jgi:hypothetical protein
MERTSRSAGRVTSWKVAIGDEISEERPKKGEKAYILGDPSLWLAERLLGPKDTSSQDCGLKKKKKEEEKILKKEKLM